MLITSAKENNRVCKPLKPLRIYFRPHDTTFAFIFFLARRCPSTIQCSSLDEITHPGIMNSEFRKTIGDLLGKGIQFEVPAYQRGYRWKQQQVGELLHDLREFIQKNEDSPQKNKRYLLQLVVVKKIDENQYEVIDGQQRLTTLFILLTFLQERYKNVCNPQKQLYTIKYKTRDSLSDYLKEIGEKSPKNIDEYYMQQAWKVFKDSWSDEPGGITGEKEAESLWKILTAETGASERVEILWLEKNDDDASETIFRNINSGKIELEESELIKSLFLRTKKDNSHLVRALQWEQIENRFYDDAFWGFLKEEDDDKIARRINILAKLMLSTDEGKGGENGKSFKTNELFICIKEKIEDPTREPGIWRKFVETFQILESWYNAPLLHNYIGLCLQIGAASLATIFKKYNYNKILLEPETETREKRFLRFLKNQIYSHLIKKGEDTEAFIGGLEYGSNNNDIKKILLTYNVELLNQQYENAPKGGKWNEDHSMFRFPFDVYTQINWQLEHISSQNESEAEWVIAIIEKEKQTLEKGSCRQLFEDGKGGRYTNWEEVQDEIKKSPGLIDKIKQGIKDDLGESLLEEDDKDRIGNLALLDNHTNESYKNALFRDKKETIISNIKKGHFVPLGTQYAFFKFFEENPTKLEYWKETDVDHQESYIIQTIDRLKK